MPICFDLSSFCFKYFHTYQRPNGGKNKLTKYTVICLDNDTERVLSLCGFPQLGHAKASSDISCPHSLHFISAIFYLILPKNRSLVLGPSTELSRMSFSKWLVLSLSKDRTEWQESALETNNTKPRIYSCYCAGLKN